MLLRALQARFRILRHESALWDLRDIVRVGETCVILHNMLVRMSQNNLFLSEGFANYDTPELVAQFYSADPACVGTEIVTAARDSAADCGAGLALVLGTTSVAPMVILIIFVYFRAFFNTGNRVTSESDHNVVRTELSQPLPAHDV